MFKTRWIYLTLISACLVSCASLKHEPKSELLTRALTLSGEGDLDAAMELFEEACKAQLKGGCLAIGEDVELPPNEGVVLTQYESSDRAAVIEYSSAGGEQLEAYLWDQDDLEPIGEEWVERTSNSNRSVLKFTSLRPTKRYRLDLYTDGGALVSSHFFKALATEGIEVVASIGRPQANSSEVRLLSKESPLWERELIPTFVISRLLKDTILKRLRLRGLDYYFVDNSEGLKESQKNSMLDQMAKSRRGVVVVSTKALAPESLVVTQLFEGINRQVRAPVVLARPGEVISISQVMLGARESALIEFSDEAQTQNIKLMTSLGVIKGDLAGKDFEVEVK